jgi:hypothetical protein
MTKRLGKPLLSRSRPLFAIVRGLGIGETLIFLRCRIILGSSILRVTESCYLGNFHTFKTLASGRGAPMAAPVVDAFHHHEPRSRHTREEARRMDFSWSTTAQFTFAIAVSSLSTYRGDPTAIRPKKLPARACRTHPKREAHHGSL